MPNLPHGCMNSTPSSPQPPSSILSTALVAMHQASAQISSSHLSTTPSTRTLATSSHLPPAHPTSSNMARLHRTNLSASFDITTNTTTSPVESATHLLLNARATFTQHLVISSICLRDAPHPAPNHTVPCSCALPSLSPLLSLLLPYYGQPVIACCLGPCFLLFPQSRSPFPCAGRLPFQVELYAL